MTSHFNGDGAALPVCPPLAMRPIPYPRTADRLAGMIDILTAAGFSLESAADMAGEITQRVEVEGVIVAKLSAQLGPERRAHPR